MLRLSAEFLFEKVYTEREIFCHSRAALESFQYVLVIPSISERSRIFPHRLGILHGV
jgi:hypothetical protein